jgi:hypothetical protein
MDPPTAGNKLLTKFTRPAGSAGLNLVKTSVLRALREAKYHFRGAYNPRGLADRSSKAHDVYEFA